MYKITESEITKWKKNLLLTPEDIQESAEDDELFIGALKLQCRAMLEWFNSPCLDHRESYVLKTSVTHGQCSKCISIAYMATKS